MAVIAGCILAYATAEAGLPGANPDDRPSTLASHLAEATIETQRSFTRLGTNPAGMAAAYADIVDGEMAATMAGVEFVISQQVEDFFLDRASGQLSTTAPTDTARPDFKRLAVTVSWESSSESVIAPVSLTEVHPDSGSITLTTVISREAHLADRVVLVDDL